MTGNTLPSGKVTFMFSDMAGSTKISKQLKEMFDSEIIKPHKVLWEEVAREFEGHIIQDSADGYLGVFANPNHALQAAIEIQSRLKSKPIKMEKDGAEYVCVLRIGLHQSEFDLFPNPSGKYDNSYTQIAYAHRVMEPGCDGQILVSETLWQAAGGNDSGRHEWFPWGNRYLKSFTEAPETLHELLWDGKSKGEPGARWAPAWYSRELNSYIERPEPMKVIRDWMEESTSGKSTPAGSLRKAPLLTIHGFGGKGKTRLAVETVLQTCSLFSAGTAFIGLDEIATSLKPEEVSAEMMSRAVARALEEDPEGFKSASDLIPLLRERVKKGNFLLILDNWESVKNPNNLDWLKELLVVGEVFCLLTSRTIAGITNVGMTYEVPFMKIPERVEEPFENYESGKLFIQRAQLNRLEGGAQWKVTQTNRPRLFEILRALMGHPLGIELVAALVYDNPTLDEIQSGLTESLMKEQRTREGDARWDHPRHLSLEASLNWSLERLPERGRAEFPRVGVIPFDFSAECAKSAGDIEPDWLKEWRRHSLLFLLPDQSENRYDMLPVVREYCLERLKPEIETYQVRYEAWCMETAKTWGDQTRENFERFIKEFRHLTSIADRLLLAPPDEESANRLNTIGNALSKLPLGDRDANLRSAIRCYEAALRVYTERDFPQNWAMTQNNLGNAYQSLPSGDRDANLRSAIRCYEVALRVYTEQKFPQDWAATQNNLGNAYSNLPSGDRDANLRSAIRCYEAALRVRTERDFPQNWATTQNNLGATYSHLPSGDRDANLRSAIRCYEAALRVRTERDFPQNWAMTQNNLGATYSHLPSGDRDANLRSAIRCYEVALRVYTEQKFPQDWAATQNNLGNAYSHLPSGDRDANLRSAIRCYEVALRVYTEQKFPQDWAMTQNNLGNAYSNLPSGDRDANLRSAIRCYEAALRVYTERNFPQDWAMTQNNLGNAYSNLTSGDRDANLRSAIRCYDAALRVYTERDFPQGWAETQQNIALTLIQMGQLDQAKAAVRKAIRGYRKCGLLSKAEILERWLEENGE